METAQLKRKHEKRSFFFSPPFFSSFGSCLCQKPVYDMFYVWREDTSMKRWAIFSHFFSWSLQATVRRRRRRHTRPGVPPWPEWLRPVSVFSFGLVSSLQPHHFVSFFSSRSPPPTKDESQTIKKKCVFASNLPDTMPTPPVMRSLLCISQISRGMSLKAYTFNWLRRAGEQASRRAGGRGAPQQKTAVFLEGRDIWTMYSKSPN